MNSLRMFWGLVVLSLGVLLIAVGEGYVDASIWTSIWLLWPVIFVVIGLRLLVRNDKLFMVLTLMVFLASALFVYSEYKSGPPSVSPIASIESLSESYDASAIKRADLVIVTGATRLKLAALPEGTPTGTLYKINSSEMGKISVVKAIEGDTAKLTIQESGQGFQASPRIIQDRELELLLSPELLLSLRLEGGATRLEMDFTNLNTVRVELAIGASDGDVILGRRSDVQNFQIEAGASNLEFLVPDEVAISAETEGGLSNVTSEPDLEIVTADKSYISKNFASSRTRIQMTVSSGLTNIKFVRK